MIASASGYILAYPDLGRLVANMAEVGNKSQIVCRCHKGKGPRHPLEYSSLGRPFLLDTRDPDRLVVVANTPCETKLLHWDPGCRYHGLEAYYLSLYLSASYIFLRLSVPPHLHTEHGFNIAHHIDSGRHPLTCFQDVPNTPYSTTLLRNVSRSSFRVSSISTTVSGETRSVSPIHWKNFLNEAIFDLTLVAEAHIALRGNQFAKNIRTSPL